jgi:hypothetical protein
MQPGYAHPIAEFHARDFGSDFLNEPDYLMAGDYGHLFFGKFSFDYVQVRAANPAGSDADENLSDGGLRDGNVANL